MAWPGKGDASDDGRDRGVLHGGAVRVFADCAVLPVLGIAADGGAYTHPVSVACIDLQVIDRLDWCKYH